MSATAAIVGAGISAAGGLGSTFVGQAKNMRLAKYQFNKNMEAWQMQNAYNTPAAQMQRLEEAGLNPNLVYGNQSVTGNTTSNVPQYQRPQIEYDLSSIPRALSMYQD